MKCFYGTTRVNQHRIKYVLRWNTIQSNQILSGDFQYACEKMSTYITLGLWTSLKFYNFIKETVRIYIVFFKKLRSLSLHLTYELVQIFIAFNWIDVSFLNKLASNCGKLIVLIFYIFIFRRFSSLVMQWISSFIL